MDRPLDSLKDTDDNKFNLNKSQTIFLIRIPLKVIVSILDISECFFLNISKCFNFFLIENAKVIGVSMQRIYISK